ncbi:MAG: hypothetical protein PHN82_12070 [bacterium]|nr:hypothetical protein [bacterium]
MSGNVGRGRRRDAPCVALLLLLAALFFHRALLDPSAVPAFRQSDFTRFLMPQISFVLQSVRRDGALPLWEPYAYSGKPPYGVPQLGVFYPCFLPVLLTGAMRTYTWLFALHFFIAALGTYLFVRELTGGRAPALFSALAFAFSGYLTARVLAGQYWHLAAIAWIPAVFLFAERLLAGGRAADALMLAGALAMQFLAGHTQYFFYCAVALLMYAVHRLVPAPPPPGGRARRVLLLAAAAAFAAALAGVALLPALEFSRHAYRANMHSLPIAAGFSLLPGDLPTLVFPFAKGSPLDSSYLGPFFFWEICAYMGLLPLGLAACSCRIVRDRRNAFFLFLAAFSLVFSMGLTLPLFPFLWRHAPGFNLFRCPSRMLALFSFAVAVAAGFGLGAVLDRRARGGAGRIVLPLAALYGAGLAASAAFAAWRGAAVAAGRMLVAFVFNRDPSGPHTMPLEAWQALVEPHYEVIRAGVAAPRQVVALAAAAAVCLLLARPRPPRRFAVAAVCAVAVADLWSVGMRMVVVRPVTEINRPTEAVAFLRRDGGLFRFHDRAGAAPIDVSEPAGLCSVSGFESVFIAPYIDALAVCNLEENRLLGLGPIEYEVHNYVALAGTDPEAVAALGDRLAFLDMLNVKYLITDRPVSREGLEEVHAGIHADGPAAGAPFFIHLNRNRLPRAWAVGGAVVARDEAESLRLTKTSDLRAVAVLRAPLPGPGAPGPAGKAAVTAYSPNRVEVEAVLDRPGYLVLGEVWYPGWRATGSDGSRHEILRVNHCLRGIRLGAGSHRIAFEYRPASYRIGRAVSAAAAAAWVLLFLPAARRRGGAP